MNGKVRIYELSKELHLDNKDILEICTQLDIAVKSHSSTIERAEADRIRIAAQNYTPSYVGAKDRGGVSAEGGSSSRAPKPERSRGQHKQQILAVHHKRHRPSSVSSSQATEKSLTPTLASPPKLLGKPQQSAVPKPTTSPPEIDASLKPPAGQQSHAAAVKDADKEQLSEVKPQPATTQIIEPEEAIAAMSVPDSQLLSPPVRPKSDKVQEKVVQQPTFKKPQKKAAPSVTPILIKTKQEKSQREREKPTSEAGIKKPESKSVKASPKPQKPQKPKPPTELKPDEEKVDVKEDLLTGTEDLPEEELLLEKPKRAQIKLKRPTTPARPGKKQQVWEEEEEESQQDQSKSKKATGKGKRRPVIIDEDEELEELEKIATAAATAVSLSIARPPKPKSISGQPVASAPKSKKPTAKVESGTREKRRERKEVTKPAEQIVLPGSLTVRELAELTRIPETDIIKKLFFKGVAVNITQTLDEETARLVTEELGIKVESAEEKSAAAKETEMLDAADLEHLQLRPPVVTIMGHVDHGKTTLLDSIRKTKVAQGEAGGITQHIGAYHVDLEHQDQEKQIVFLDTPGHEAFTAMRARGTRVTDIAVLVVAADDGVQPQTKEAISHARAAEVPLIVAINKVDKPEAEPDRLKQELTEQGLVPEEWGGETIMVPVSALKGENLDTLLEMILLVAELEELSANPDRSARGTVIEANLDRTRGPVATLLVQNGTLRIGDIIVAGSVSGKIRAMIDDRGEKVEAATPSFAVEVLGLNEVPAAGDEFEVFENEKEARTVAEQRAEEQRQDRLQKALSSRRVSLSTLSEQAREGELKELNLIVKADVQGSIEAILGSLQQLPQDEVQIRVLMAAPGEVTETDVDLAAASGAVIVGFNTTLASGSRIAADREGVDIREYDIIYKLLDDIQGAMEGLLEPEEVEQPLGQAEVRAVFPVGRGAVAGCYVQSGKVMRNRFLRVRRNGEVIFTGIMDSLKRIKEDVREVSAGYECGIGCAKFNDWQEGDIIEAYEMVMKRRTLSVN
ncbi:MAG: translation initiation factor IF-2 [Prochloraceae cyanobacterium]